MIITERTENGKGLRYCGTCLATCGRHEIGCSEAREQPVARILDAAPDLLDDAERRALAAELVNGLAAACLPVDAAIAAMEKPRK